MPRKRSTYTAEFELQAVRMITDQKLSVAAVARRLDVGENLLRQWKKAFLDRGPDAFPGQGNLPPADDEVRRGQVHAGLGQPGEDAELPGDAGHASAAQHEGPAFSCHGLILPGTRPRHGL